MTRQRTVNYFCTLLVISAILVTVIASFSRASAQSVVAASISSTAYNGNGYCMVLQVDNYKPTKSVTIVLQTNDTKILNVNFDRYTSGSFTEHSITVVLTRPDNYQKSWWGNPNTFSFSISVEGTLSDLYVSSLAPVYEGMTTAQATTLQTTQSPQTTDATTVIQTASINNDGGSSDVVTNNEQQADQTQEQNIESLAQQSEEVSAQTTEEDVIDSEDESNTTISLENAAALALVSGSDDSSGGNSNGTSETTKAGTAAEDRNLILSSNNSAMNSISALVMLMLFGVGLVVVGGLEIYSKVNNVSVATVMSMLLSESLLKKKALAAIAGTIKIKQRIKDKLGIKEKTIAYRDPFADDFEENVRYVHGRPVTKNNRYRIPEVEPSEVEPSEVEETDIK